MRFIAAYNARRLSDALALLAPDANASDCDYENVRGLKFVGRRQVAAWLRQRFRDRDRLTVSRISAKDPSQPVGVLLVEYARRASDTLRALGYVNGIVPDVATKVPFGGTATRPLILGFGFGPWDGPDAACRI